MPTLDSLQSEINDIKERNRRVERDKAWETSWTRRIVLFVLTYAVVVIVFAFAKLEKPFLNALIPAIAFVISTLSLSYFKQQWINKQNHE